MILTSEVESKEQRRTARQQAKQERQERKAARQAAFNALSPEEREAEMQRRRDMVAAFKAKAANRTPEERAAHLAAKEVRRAAKLAARSERQRLRQVRSPAAAPNQGVDAAARADVGGDDMKEQVQRLRALRTERRQRELTVDEERALRSLCASVQRWRSERRAAKHAGADSGAGDREAVGIELSDAVQRLQALRAERRQRALSEEEQVALKTLRATVQQLRAERRARHRQSPNEDAATTTTVAPAVPPPPPPASSTAGAPLLCASPVSVDELDDALQRLRVLRAERRQRTLTDDEQHALQTLRATVKRLRVERRAACRTDDHDDVSAPVTSTPLPTPPAVAVAASTTTTTTTTSSSSSSSIPQRSHHHRGRGGAGRFLGPRGVRGGSDGAPTQLGVYEACRWLQQASADIDVAAHLATGGHHSHACFLSHETAEKSFKAVLFAAGRAVEASHSLRQYVKAVQDVGELSMSSVPELPERLRALQRYHTSTRYPSVRRTEQGLAPVHGFTAEDAATSVATARDLLTLATAYIERVKNTVFPASLSVAEIAVAVDDPSSSSSSSESDE